MRTNANIITNGQVVAISAIEWRVDMNVPTIVSTRRGS